MKRRTTWLGFAALVLASGSRWVLATYFPGNLPILAEQSLHELAISVVLGIASLPTDRGSLGWRRIRGIAGYGTVLLALPSILIELSRSSVSQSAGLAMLTLAPAAVVAIAAQQSAGFGTADGSWGLLLPALAGAGGALLLIPVAIPPIWQGKVWLAVLGLGCVPVALSCIRLHRLLKGVPLFSVAAIVYGVSGLATAAFSLRQLAISWNVHDALRESAFCLMLDGPLALLTIWLLRELEPVRFSSRYLLVLFVSILESFLILHTGFNVTNLTGLALMLGGSAVLASASGDRTNPGLSLK